MFNHQNKRYQLGGGLLPYAGHRYQHGNGFFSGLMKRAIVPFLKYIGSKSLNTIGEFASEAVRDPDNFKAIAKRKALEMTGDVLEDAGKRAKKFVQTGQGVASIKGFTTSKPSFKLPRERLLGNSKKDRLLKKRKIKEIERRMSKSYYSTLGM